MKIAFVLFCLSLAPPVWGGELFREANSPNEKMLSDIQKENAPSNNKELAGFRGIAWGTSLQSISGLTEIKSGSSDVKEYTRNADEMQLGGAKLDRIIYRFWNDQFFEVSLQTTGVINIQELKNVTFQKFGRMTQPNQFLEDYIKTMRTTQIFLLCPPVTDAAFLTIRYRPLQKLREKAAKARAQEGADNGF
ncbi:MAG TPA: hypothetical protein P5079_03510 [Elusimicrobiota bacterium]|nr:hypothetical protein [Elusimicrobiota bacterium]